MWNFDISYYIRYDISLTNTNKNIYDDKYVTHNENNNSDHNTVIASITNDICIIIFSFI